MSKTGQESILSRFFSSKNRQRKADSYLCKFWKEIGAVFPKGINFFVRQNRLFKRKKLPLMLLKGFPQN